MLGVIQSTIYVPVAGIERAISEDFKFGEMTLFNSIENNVLDFFELYGGIIVDRQNVIKFLKDSPFVVNCFNETVFNLSTYFDQASLKLEITQIDSEKPELFLIAKIKISPEEAINKLNKFDEWFVPTVFKEFSRFNVNIEFI